MTLVNSLFETPWWLDAVAPGEWEAIEVGDNGRAVARLAYVRRTRLGRTALVQPRLTPALGPCLAEIDGSEPHRLEEAKDRMQALIEQLPAFDLFDQNFSPAVTNWLPFYWRGFSSSLRYTYRLELADLDEVWARLAQTARAHIRRAEKQLVVRDDLTLEDFVQIYASPFRRQGIPAPDQELVRGIDAACAARGVRKILFAVDARERVHAATYTVWDEKTTFGLMNCRDEELAGGSAVSLLVWHAIRHAATVTPVFDFEGSMLEGVERFIRSFGARQVPYLHVWKIQGLLRPLAAARELARWATHRPPAA
jgi:hypothetical protein